MNIPPIPKRIPLAEPGDVYLIPLKDGMKCYMQFLMLDEEALNSEVVRVFKKKFNENQDPLLDEIVKDEVNFYIHVDIRSGIKQGLYFKVGNVVTTNLDPPRFKSTRGDYDTPAGQVSDKWYVWEVGKEAEKIGLLTDEYRNLDTGGIYPPSDILYRIYHGESEFKSPI